MRDEEPKEIKEKVIKCLNNAELTPSGIEKKEKEIKKWVKISTGCLVGSILLFLLLYKVKVDDSFYSLGQGAAVFLSCIGLVVFIFGVIGFYLIWQDWRLICRSKKTN
mgnify:CR=1 FL=1